MKFKKIRKDEICLRSLPVFYFTELKNTAGNIGITLNSHLKKQIREIANTYPDKMKQKPDNEKLKQFRIQGISPILVEQLHNIAINSGAELNSFLNIKLKELNDCQPDRMKIKLDY